MAAIGQILEGKYKILAKLGSGGMSTVFLAMDTRLNKQWAVKEIRKKGRGKEDEIIIHSFLVEAEMMKKLDHPALPRIVDIIENDETIYVVMDYIEGESLDKVLEAEGVQDEERVIEWAMQLCEALGYLHSQKPPIIYRDMKPANVMLRPEGNIKIIDFGIAREYKEEKLADTALLGTKGYAPPEQYGGQRQTDPRSDIFALGMTMHHLLTGIDPRTGEEYAPVRAWNPNLSEGIEVIINKCVEPAAENRYQSCAELMYDLQHPELIVSGYKRKQKIKLAAFLSAGILALLLAVTGFACSQAAIYTQNNDYESLVSLSTATDLDSKVESYKKAIALYPDRVEAYRRLLEAYEDNNQFGEAENMEFTSLYNGNRRYLDDSSSDVAELRYLIGRMYYVIYKKNGEEKSINECVNKAFPFFEENNIHSEVPFEHRELSDSYYQICTFYRTYIFESSDVKEPSSEEYTALLNTLTEKTEAIQSFESYDRLSFYNAVFFLLHDQMKSFARAKINQETVLALMDKVYQESESLGELSRVQSKELQSEIIDNYSSYREEVITSFQNQNKNSREEG